LFADEAFHGECPLFSHTIDSLLVCFFAIVVVAMTFVSRRPLKNKKKYFPLKANNKTAKR
jgi:hypothetical protein